MTATDYDDVAIEVPESNGEFEAVPSGAYLAKLTNFKVEDKPQWKIEAQERAEMAKEPDKRRLPINPKQFAWTFTITAGEWEGQKLTSWQNVSWHERSNSAKYAAALLDIDRLRPDMGMSTRQLIGRPCQIFVTEKEGKSYIDKVLPQPKPKQAKAMAAHRQATTVEALDEHLTEPDLDF